MQLEQIRVKGKIELRPKLKEDRPLFLHCSGGYQSVTTRYYNSHVENLLFLHGVSSIGIICLPRKEGEKK